MLIHGFGADRYSWTALVPALSRSHTLHAAELAGRVRAHPKLVLAAPPALNLVCLRHVDGDDATRALMAALNATVVFHHVLDETQD